MLRMISPALPRSFAAYEIKITIYFQISHLNPSTMTNFSNVSHEIAYFGRGRKISYKQARTKKTSNTRS